MVLLIKNKHASFEDFTHLSDSPAGDTLRKRLTKLSIQSLRNAGVPKAKSMPHINLSGEGGSFKAHCSAVLNADLHKLKPRELIARKVKSAKEDLRQLFDNASLKQRVELARGPSDSISVELACSTTAPNVGAPSSLDPSSSLAMSVPAPSDEQDKEVKNHVQCLAVVAQSWLNFEQLFSRRRALFDQTIEEARHDFCQALVQSFSDCSPTASPLQVPQSSGNPSVLPLPHRISSSPVASTAPSAITLADQTTVFPCLFECVEPKKPAQSPEFSDEDLKREFDNFSFDSSQDEEWTSEVESRKQNAMNRALSDMKRKLAVPVPKLSSYFSDDSLADSAAHRTLVNPRASCSGASSQDTDNSSFYSADQEDEAEENDESVAASCPDSPVSTATLDDDAVNIPTCPVELPLSGQMDDSTWDDKQDHSDPRDIADGTDDVWEVLATYVPRLLTRISEESLADEYEIEATAQPPLSFRRPVSQYRKVLRFRCQGISYLDRTGQVDSMPAAPLAEGTGSPEAATSNVETSVAIADTDNDPSSPSVLNPGRTLRRVKKFMGLKNPLGFPTVQSTSSIETTHETISLDEEACRLESKARRLRRVHGCLNLRAFGGTDIPTATPPSLSGMQGYYPQSLGRRSSFKERQRLPDLEQGCEIQPASSRCHPLTRENSTKPPIPPKPPGFRLHRERVQLSSATIREPSSLCSRCDPSSSLPLWSCAKITQSKGKRGRPPNESTKALKKRLGSIRIDPETIHGHPPQRCHEKTFPSLAPDNESRKAKTFKKMENSRKTINESDRDANRRKSENLQKQERYISPVTCDLRGRKKVTFPGGLGLTVTVDVP